MPQLGAARYEDETLVASYAITGHPSVFFAYSHYYGPVGVRPVAARPRK